MAKYLSRNMDVILKNELEAFGCVLIVGPKWCGKTTTAARFSKSILYMEEDLNNIELAKTKPSLLLIGDNPRLIDEWQTAPELWDAIRFDIDQKNMQGLYILTGSTTVNEKNIYHTGAGRIVRVLMRTMSLYESKDSNGKVSLSDLFNKKQDISCKSDLSIEDIAYLIIRGGWPGTIGKELKVVKRQITGYCNTIINSDISSVDGVKRDPLIAAAIMRSLARNTATQAANTTILDDVKSNNSLISMNTLSSYIKALERLYVIEDLPAWSPKLRSTTAIRTKNTRHFIDPAIAANMLGTNQKNLLFDLNTMGFLFESLVIRDLRVYSQQLDGHVYHYRDKTGLEVDAIINLDDGRWAAVEVKLGPNRVEEGAKNLVKFSKLVDYEKMGKPSFLMVITATGYGYKRNDGVFVVPIGCLKQ